MMRELHLSQKDLDEMEEEDYRYKAICLRREKKMASKNKPGE